jgi:probable rRNA maturation factor
MAVQWLCPASPLEDRQVYALWRETLRYAKAADQDVTLRCVSAEEMQQLNKQYRGKDTPTNVLTFSYGKGVHDIALCLDVIENEAAQQSADPKDYLALVVVHGFLHALGMDHERSRQDEAKTLQAEKDILQAQNFAPASLAAHL